MLRENCLDFGQRSFVVVQYGTRHTAQFYHCYSLTSSLLSGDATDQLHTSDATGSVELPAQNLIAWPKLWRRDVAVAKLFFQTYQFPPNCQCLVRQSDLLFRTELGRRSRTSECCAFIRLSKRTVFAQGLFTAASHQWPWSRTFYFVILFGGPSRRRALICKGCNNITKETTLERPAAHFAS